jgi:hypothetical protein
LAEFEENDKELEEIAGKIANALEHVKESALNIADSIDK